MDEANPRINGDAAASVAVGIKQFGFRQPVVVDAKGVIIVGYACYKAAQKLGLNKAPVHRAKDSGQDLSPEQIKVNRIADNQAARLAESDFDLLPIEAFQSSTTVARTPSSKSAAVAR